MVRLLPNGLIGREFLKKESLPLSLSDFLEAGSSAGDPHTPPSSLTPFVQDVASTPEAFFEGRPYRAGRLLGSGRLHLSNSELNRLKMWRSPVQAWQGTACPVVTSAAILMTTTEHKVSLSRRA